MKKFKFLSIAILFVAILVMPILAGCAKTCTVDISITGGNGNGGWIFKNYISAYGKSSIKEGEKYSVYISPKDGYKIGQIKVDGEVYDKAFDITGYDFSMIVEDDTNIEVTFETYSYNFKIYTATYSGDGTAFTGWQEYEGYNLTAKHGERILLATSSANDVLNPANFSADIKEYYDDNGGLFFVENAGVKTWISHSVGFVVKNGSYEFETNLTKEQLDEVLLPIHDITIADATVYESGDAEAPYGTISVAGDTIDGSETFQIRKTKQLVFSINAKSGYTIDKIFVNNSEFVGYEAGAQSFSFTLTVQGDVEYKISFKPVDPVGSESAQA